MSIAVITAAVALAPTALKVVNAGIAGLKAAHSYTADTSLIDISKASRVEPLTIVGADCLHLEYLPDILQSLNSIFAGYYLQALSYTASVGHIRATNVLERLNPNRNYTNASLFGLESFKNSLTDWRMGAEAYKFNLPTTKNKRAMAFECQRIESTMNTTSYVVLDNKRKVQVSMEDFTVGMEGSKYADKRAARIRDNEEPIEDIVIPPSAEVTPEQKNIMDDWAASHGYQKDAEVDHEYQAKLAHGYQQDLEKDEQNYYKNLADDINATNALIKEQKEAAAKLASNGKPTISISKDSVEQARELADLSVGRMITVEVGGGSDAHGNKIPMVPIQLAIRLMVNSVPESTLQGLLSKGAVDNSMTERYHAWRAGRIEFVRDLIFCQDIIDETKKSMMDDKTGVHMEIVNRVNNSKKYGLVSKNPSLNVSSNLFVISEVSAANIERQLGGKLSSVHVREKIFKTGYAMIICVVNRQYERVTFYHRGINASTDVSLKDIRISNRKSGPDVGDILKAYMAGNSPAI